MFRFSRRLFLVLLLMSACGKPSLKAEQWIIGTVSYGKQEQVISQYEGFKRYFEQKTRSLVMLEPTFNENKALERIKSQAWSLVFAPPGLAAVAIAQHQYIPLLPLEQVDNKGSVIVVRSDSSFDNLNSLTRQVVILGQPGSATGYYFPIFNLYGLTLAELLFSSSPKNVLETIAQGKAAAGALSMEQFNTYKTQIPNVEFRIIFTDLHPVPSGAVLISPNIDKKRQQEILDIFNETPSGLASEAGFLPNTPLPDYKYMISVVERVRAILPNSYPNQKPVRLF